MAKKNYAMEQYDSTKYREIVSDARDLITSYDKRDEMQADMQSIYLMDLDKDIPESSTQHQKLTISPDITNKLQGAQRLLVSTEPQFSMPYEENDTQAQEASGWMEKSARLMWLASGRLSGMPIENDAVLSALTFGQVDISLINLLEKLEMIPKENKVAYSRMEAAVAMTPIKFEVWKPGYAMSDGLGLIAYLRRYRINPRKLKTEWPGVDLDHLSKALVEVWDWYDTEWRVVWISGGTSDKDKSAIFMRKHELSFIPIISQIAEGSKIFENPEDQVRPFAYNVWKSKLDKRLNLALTALYTNIFALASNAQFIHTKPPGNPEKILESKFHIVGGVWELEQGEEFAPMLAKGAIDPALMQAIEIAERKLTESTIYSQALGEPLGSSAAFSMVALLHQAGRLPLATPKKLTGWAIGSAMELAFRWLKENGGTVKIKFQGESAEIRASEIPDSFSFDAKLDIDLPSDMLQNANAAQVLGALKLASKRWIRENLLQIEASDEMDKEVWAEQMADQLAMKLFTEMQLQAQQAEAMAMQQGGPPGGTMPPGGPVESTGQGGITGKQQDQGVPLQAPLPPRRMG
jgi:hypothetical protein